ncbi:DUF4340 domain-containing protein [Thermodesulfobacteriota bacterium]
MRYRATVIYLIAASIAAGLYFFDLRHRKDQTRQEEKAKRLIQTEFNNVETISFEKSSVRIVLNKKSDSSEEWTLAEPIKSPTEKFAVEQLKKDLSELKYSRLIIDNPENLSQFGLDDPSLTIKFTTKKESGSIFFGTQNPSEDGFYTSTGYDGKVFLIDKSAKDKVDISLYQLREKRLFSISFDKVKKFIIERDSEKWILIKKDGSWQFKSDSNFKVEPKKIDSLVRMFVMSEALSFEKENSNALESFGLEKPSAEISLSDEKTSQKILLGRPFDKDDSKIYAKMSNRPQIITVNKWLLSDLPKSRQLIKNITEDQKKEKKIKPDNS